MRRRIETPPELRGTTEQKLLELRSYLFRLAERLNVVLNTDTATPQGETDPAALHALSAMVQRNAQSARADIAGLRTELLALIPGGDTAADSVAAESVFPGDDADWHVRRWQSGRVELWSFKAMNTAVDAAASVPLPFALDTSRSMAFVTIQSGSVAWAAGVELSAESIDFLAVWADNSTELVGTAQIYITGYPAEGG